MDFVTGIAILTILLILIPWLWRYRIRPRFAIEELNEKLKKHPDRKRIKKTERLLATLYQDINSAQISKSDRKRFGLDQDAYIYGEIQFLSFFYLLEKIAPKPQEIFYDLGSGSGKAVFAAALFFDLTKACGIEKLPTLVKTAESLVPKIKSLDPTQRTAQIEFINDDFLQHDFSDGDIIFINATCFSYPTWEALVGKLTQLKPGSPVIVTTKKITSDQFKLISQSLELQSWGMNSVNIYEKIS